MSNNGAPPIVPGGGLGLIQRLDRLDNVLSELEDKAAEALPRSSLSSSVSLWYGHSISCPSTPSGLEKRCKPAESVLVEVKQKGTLVERVEQLEERVFTLGETLRPVLSRRFSKVDIPPHAVLSSPPHEARAGEQASSPDIPAVEEKREVSPSEREPTEMPTHRLEAGVGTAASKEDVHGRVHEETAHKEPEPGTIRDEHSRLASFDMFKRAVHLPANKAKALRKRLSKSLKRMFLRVHKTSKLE